MEAKIPNEEGTVKFQEIKFSVLTHCFVQRLNTNK